MNPGGNSQTPIVSGMFDSHLSKSLAGEEQMLVKQNQWFVDFMCQTTSLWISEDCSWYKHRKFSLRFNVDGNHMIIMKGYHPDTGTTWLHGVVHEQKLKKNSDQSMKMYYLMQIKSEVLFVSDRLICCFLPLPCFKLVLYTKELRVRKKAPQTNSKSEQKKYGGLCWKNVAPLSAAGMLAALPVRRREVPGRNKLMKCKTIPASCHLLID